MAGGVAVAAPTVTFLLFYTTYSRHAKKVADHGHIIRWSTIGDSFVIVDTEQIPKILPLYFKTASYASFVRQLNAYGFSKVRSREGGHEFRNDAFRRGETSSFHLHKRTAKQSLCDSGHEKQSAALQEKVKTLGRQIEESKMQVDSLGLLNHNLVSINKDLLLEWDKRQQDFELRVRKLMFLLLTRLKYKPLGSVTGQRMQSFFISEGLISASETFPHIDLDQSSFNFLQRMSEKFADPQDLDHRFVNRILDIHISSINEEMRQRASGTFVNFREQEERYATSQAISVNLFMKVYLEILSKNNAHLTWEDVSRSRRTEDQSVFSFDKLSVNNESVMESISRLSDILANTKDVVSRQR